MFVGRLMYPPGTRTFPGTGHPGRTPYRSPQARVSAPPPFPCHREAPCSPPSPRIWGERDGGGSCPIPEGTNLGGGGTGRGWPPCPGEGGLVGVSLAAPQPPRGRQRFCGQQPPSWGSPALGYGCKGAIRQQAAGEGRLDSCGAVAGEAEELSLCPNSPITQGSSPCMGRPNPPLTPSGAGFPPPPAPGYVAAPGFIIPQVQKHHLCKKAPCKSEEPCFPVLPAARTAAASSSQPRAASRPGISRDAPRNQAEPSPNRLQNALPPCPRKGIFKIWSRPSS